MDEHTAEAHGEPYTELRCTTAAAFLDCISPQGSYFSDKLMHTFSTGHGVPTWVFRGQGDSGHTLLPRALRPDEPMLLTGGWKPLAPPMTNGDQARAEFSMLRAFYWAADEEGLALPEDTQQYRSFFAPEIAKPHSLLQRRGDWLPNELLSLAALAQHYGLATRLLDWSFDPLVAAYFAGTGGLASSSQDLCVWCLDLSALWSVPQRLKIRGFLKPVSAPKAGNPNLAAQDALFTMHVPEPFAWEAPRVAIPLEELVNQWSGIRDMPILVKVVMPNAEALTLLELLRRYRITGATVFPGYGGIVKSLQERGEWGIGRVTLQSIRLPRYFLPSEP